MALIALYSRSRDMRRRLRATLEPFHQVDGCPSWQSFRLLVRERPATVGLVDLASLGGVEGATGRLQRFRSSFPGLGLVVVAEGRQNPVMLFRLGSMTIRNLVLLDVEEGARSLPRAVGRSLETGAASRVVRTAALHVPPRELEAVRRAMEGVHHRWSAKALADEVGLSRPFLSECFKEWGLPSVGHFLVWTRLLHAGYWLTDPGRTGESVARQLEYCDGSAFRRALRQRTRATPTEVVERGGFEFVLDRFLEACDFDEERTGRRFSAA